MVAKEPRLARYWIPFSTPVVAEMRNITVTRTMMMATWLDFGTPYRYCRPLLSCSPLSPSAVAVPKSVAMIARESTTRPSGVLWASGPNKGVNVALTRIGVPLRKAK